MISKSMEKEDEDLAVVVSASLKGNLAQGVVKKSKRVAEERETGVQIRTKPGLLKGLQQKI